MTQTEISYLADSPPEAVKGVEGHIIIDIYFPAEAIHPHMRIRQKDSSHVLTKKTRIDEGDASTHIEENIELTKEEFIAGGMLAGKTLQDILPDLNRLGYRPSL